jgi:hypothetical protein
MQSAEFKKVIAQAIELLPASASQALSQSSLWISGENVPCTVSPCTAGETVRPRDSSGEYKITLPLSEFLQPDAKRVLAHELFHVLQHLLDPRDASWTKEAQAALGWYREGMAQLFEYRMSGKPNGPDLQVAFEKMDSALMAPFDPDHLSGESYGHSFLYFFYIWRECGGDEVLKALALEPSPQSPRKTIEAALRGTKLQCRDFDSSATAVELARVMNHAETMGSDAYQHLLWPSQYARNYLKGQVTKAELGALPAYQPWVAVAEAEWKGPLPAGITRHWLHLSLPYRTQTERPVALDSSWVQVFLKH